MSRASRQLSMGAGIIVAGLVTLWLIFGGGGSVSTENAYLKADKLTLSSEVSGKIVEVPVRAHQPVEAGQLLVQIEDTPYRIAVAEAEANLALVRNQVEARRADYQEVAANLEQARSDAAFFERQLARSEKMGPSAISESELDQARQELTRARSQIAITTQQLSALRAELGGSPEAPLESQADVRVAQAQLDRARYQLERTRITAPVAGTIANEVPQVGEMAHGGLTLLTLMDTHTVWVEANLKETQLEHIRPGQRASVEVDAYPGLELEAEVESLSPASGSEFALIPAQNASGNWVKVVQRVPVRLRLSLPARDYTLRPGMSAEVHIDVSEAAASSLGEPGNAVTALLP